jgi:hypothetical protein
MLLRQAARELVEALAVVAHLIEHAGGRRQVRRPDLVDLVIDRVLEPGAALDRVECLANGQHRLENLQRPGPHRQSHATVRKLKLGLAPAMGHIEQVAVDLAPSPQHRSANCPRSRQNSRNTSRKRPCTSSIPSGW